MLLSRSMFTRPSDIRPFKTALAFALLALLAGRAEAGRAAFPSTDVRVQVPSAKQVDEDEATVGSDGIDAEQALQVDFASTRTFANTRLASQDTELSALPTSQAFDEAATGEIRGKLLLQAMADLPQVGAAASYSSLSLDYWDDASSARTTVDNRARGAADSAQGNARGGDAHSNVMIPLPMAAWSGLSVFGGVGFVAGLRRISRRFF